MLLGIATLQLGMPNANLDLVAMIADGTPLLVRAPDQAD